MNNTENLTIISPVYNGMPYIKECIDSVIKQTYKDWQLIISDDNSKDDTKKYLKTISDSRVSIYFQERNLGIFGNLNFLITKVETEYCIILCNDDYFESEKSLEEVVRFWSEAPSNIGFVRFNQKNNNNLLPSIIKKEKSSLYFFLYGNIPGNLSNVSFKTSIIKKEFPFNEKYPYTGDFEFWVRLTKITDLYISNKEVTHIRRHPNTASNYLNRKGELIAQQGDIANYLYSEAINKYPRYKRYFKLHAVIVYDFIHRKIAYKLYFKGGKDYLQAFNNYKRNYRFKYNGFITWLLFMVTLGGKYFRSFALKRVLKNIKDN